MEEECRGCFLIRTIKEDPLFNDEKMIRCEHDHLDCPCKSCLVKVVCDQINRFEECEKFVNFNAKNPANDYWKRIAKDLENANTI